MITEFAPAKINLYLHVVGRRADGYHLLESAVVFASVGDCVKVETREDGDIVLHIEGKFAPALQEAQQNLAYRAAHRVKAIFAPQQGATIILEKQLPVASGMGGGSADAAATLRALKQAWNLPDDARWTEIAAALGADVPVCLLSRAASMSGVGDGVAPMRAPSMHMVLANPNQPLPTKDVFAAYAKSNRAFSPAQWCGDFADAHNDLQETAISLLPVIQTCLAALAAQGCTYARMSGSGATCFGVFETAEQAGRAAQSMQAAHPDWWITSTATKED